MLKNIKVSLIVLLSVSIYNCINYEDIPEVDDTVVVENVATITTEEIIEPIIECSEPIDSLIDFYKYEISYYCSCYSCTQNTKDIGRTASGEYAVEGITVATPKDIPFGSVLYIDGLGEFIVQDRGGYINYTTDYYGNTVMRVDIYLDNHEECYERGRHYGYGYIIREDN